MERRHAAGEGPRKAGVLRPHRMFGPDFGARRAGRLVTIGQGLDAGAGVVAKMTVNVDDAGGNELALRVDHRGAGRNGDGGADLGDLAVFQPDRTGREFLAGAVIYGGVLDHRRHTRIGAIGRRIRIERNRHELGGFPAGGCGRRGLGGRTAGDQQQNGEALQSHQFTPCIQRFSNGEIASKTTPMMADAIPMVWNTPA